MGDAGLAIPLPEPQLPISQPTADPSPSQPREIHILVTGFGPFKSFTNNPSYLIASTLPQVLSPAPPPPPPSKDSSKPQPVRAYLPSFLNRHLSANPQRDHAQSTPQPVRTANEKPYIIHVHTYPDPIHVAYAPTSVLIPSLLNPATNGTMFPEFPGGVDFDYVLHIGLASGRDSYTLETLAHRDDYLIPDVDDSVGTAISDIWKRQDVPGSLEVGWDGADVLRRWKAEVERRETESNVEEVPGRTQVSIPAIDPDRSSTPTSNDNAQQSANDEPAKAWIRQHGVLLHSSSTTTPQSHQESTPSPQTDSNLPSYTPIGGGSGLRQNINAAANTSTSTSTTQKPIRKSVVKLSRDAGRFLCEFILMCSLIYRFKQHQYTPITSDSESKLGKVAFLHVPNGTEPADVARGAMIAESAIRSFVASWEAGWRNVSVYEDEEGVVTGSKTAAGVGEGRFEDKGTGDEIPR